MRKASTSTGLAAFAVALAASAIAAEPDAGAAPKPILFMAMSRIEVDAQGMVVAVAPSPGLPDAVNAALAENLRKLRFTPAQIDGRAVGGVTFARQEACAVPRDGNYQLAVRYLGNGPGARIGGGKVPPPRYPTDAMRSGASARVTVSYTVQSDGRVVVDSTELVSGRGRYAQDFQKAARNWMDGQQIQPEQLDGRPVATRVRMDVMFETGPGETFSGPNARQMAQRSMEKEMEQRREAQVASSTACATAARPPDAPEQVALNSPFQLQVAQ